MSYALWQRVQLWGIASALVRVPREGSKVVRHVPPTEGKEELPDALPAALRLHGARRLHRLARFWLCLLILFRRFHKTLHLAWTGRGRQVGGRRDGCKRGDGEGQRGAGGPFIGGVGWDGMDRGLGWGAEGSGGGVGWACRWRGSPG